MWSSPRPCVREEPGCAWRGQKYGHAKKKGALRVGPSQERTMHASWEGTLPEAGAWQKREGSWSAMNSRVPVHAEQGPCT